MFLRVENKNQLQNAINSIQQCDLRLSDKPFGPEVLTQRKKRASITALSFPPESALSIGFFEEVNTDEKQAVALERQFHTSTVPLEGVKGTVVVFRSLYPVDRLTEVLQTSNIPYEKLRAKRVTEMPEEEFAHIKGGILFLNEIFIYPKSPSGTSQKFTQ